MSLIYIESPRGTLVRSRGQEREREEGGGRNAPMANTQTDEFIKTMTANRVQLAKAGHYKEVWFYERRQREGERAADREGVKWKGGVIGWAAGKRVLFEFINVRGRGRKLWR